MSAEATLLEAPTLRAWFGGALRLLETHRDALDALNVFPVADSDTGTNLALTIGEAVSAVASVPHDASAARVGAALARGALVGARGNSGVIVGQYLGAVLRHVASHGAADPAQALAVGADAAYRAVDRPVEGTVLTVARAVADGARAAVVVDPVQVLVAGCAAGWSALDRTPAQLGALGRAGVVDAGGLGLLLVLDGLLHALGVDGDDRAEAVLAPGRRPAAPTDGCAVDDPSQDGPDAGGEFEVMFVVAPDATTHGVPGPGAPGGQDGVAGALTAALRPLGGSLAVVGAGDLWQAHVHTDRPLDVVQVPVPAGTTRSQVRVRHLATQAGGRRSRRPLGLVAVTSAVGLVPDLARAGAVVVVVEPGRAPGPELARAVADTGSGHVLVLSCVALGPDAGGGTRQRAHVDVVDGLVETQLVSGSATLASLDPDLGDAALLGLVWDAVHRVRSARTDARPGAASEAARELLTDGTELMTVLVGAGVAVEAADGVVAAVREVAAVHGVEVVVHLGAVLGDGLMLGAE